MRRLAFLVVAGCAAHAGAPLANTGPAPAPEIAKAPLDEQGAKICTDPKPSTDDVCACLADQGEYGPPCEFRDDASTPGARIAVAGGGQGRFWHLVTKGPAGWRNVDVVGYEQGHGKRESSITRSDVRREGELIIVTYDEESDTTFAIDPPTYDEQMKTTHEVYCREDGCFLDAVTACSFEDDYDQGGAKKKGSSSAHVTIESHAIVVEGEGPAKGPCAVKRGRWTF